MLVKLSGGRLAQATVKALRETTDGVRLQVSFGKRRRWSTRGRLLMGPTNRVPLPGNAEQQSEDF